MKLLTKFNLVLIVFFGISGFVISHLAYQFLMRNAREQVLQQAELMMASAKSTRDYTSEQVKPLLLQHPEHATRFLPQTVPAFAATSVFNSIHFQGKKDTRLINRDTTVKDQIVIAHQVHRSLFLDEAHLIAERLALQEGVPQLSHTFFLFR